MSKYLFKEGNNLHDIHFGPLSPSYSRYAGSDENAWYEAAPWQIILLMNVNYFTTNYFVGEDSSRVYAFEKDIVEKLEFDFFREDQASQLTAIISGIEFKNNTSYELEIYKFDTRTQTEEKIFIKNGTVDSGNTIPIPNCPMLYEYFNTSHVYNYRFVIKISSENQGVYNLTISHYSFRYYTAGNDFFGSFSSVVTNRQSINNITEFNGWAEGDITYYFYPYSDGENYWSKN